MEKIAAVVVTFNRIALLKACLAALMGQTRKLDTIIVVNNGSTDGTADYLNEHDEFQTIHQENLGGAGGFSTGMQVAYKQGYDWIWLMDDDAFPELECLSHLLKHVELPHNKALVLAPLVVEGDKIDHLHRGHIDFKKIKYPLQTGTSNTIFNTSGSVSVEFVSFIGMLIGRNIIKEIGFPFPSYFIFHDDVEYSIRIVKNGFPMLLIKNAVIFHKMVGKWEPPSQIEESFIESTKRRRTLAEMYYDKRNKYAELSRSDILSFVGKRNWIWTIVQHGGISYRLVLFLTKDIFKASLYIMLSKANRIEILSLYWHTYWQGLSGKFDNSHILSMKQT